VICEANMPKRAGFTAFACRKKQKCKNIKIECTIGLENMFTPDKPIESAKDDLLGRSSFATALGDAIITYKETDSLVIGLYGAWGSGKTSIINMALEHIYAEHRKDHTNTPPIVVQFDPWNFSDQNQLLTQFFKQLSTALKEPDRPKYIERAGWILERYSELVAPPLAVMSGPMGPVAMVSAGVAKGAGTAIRHRSERKLKDLHTARTKLDEILKKQSQKIVVTLDNIDRLNNAEMRQMFQLIKSLADFPNTVYVLAFDKKVVINALAGEQIDGLQYLEKIVQVPMDVPLLSPQGVEPLLFSQLDAVFTASPPTIWDQQHWVNVYTSGLGAFFRNLRDVRRYINALRFSFSLVNEEVNAVDFFAITALQVFVPALYDEVRHNKDLFAGVFYDFNDKKKIGDAKAQFDKIFGEATSSSERAQSLQKPLRDLLRLLFPKLESLYGFTNYSGDWLDQWRKACRVCYPDLFDRFFALSLREGELSQGEMQAVLSLSDNPESFSAALERLNNEGKATQFVALLRDYTGDQIRIPDSHIETVVTALLNAGDRFPESDGFLAIPTSSAIGFRIMELISRLPDQQTRFELLNRAIEHTTESVYTIISVIIDHRLEHGKSENKERLKPVEARAISENQLEKLQGLMCSKISEWAARDMLLQHPKSSLILSVWQDWCPSAKANDFVDNLIRTDAGLLNFVAACTTPVPSSSIRDYAGQPKWAIYPKVLAQFVKLSDIEPRIRKIMDTTPSENLNERELGALITLLRFFDDEGYRKELERFGG
jgi:predicted KAP-like P-loop ATPase